MSKDYEEDYVELSDKEEEIINYYTDNNEVEDEESEIIEDDEEEYEEFDEDLEEEYEEDDDEDTIEEYQEFRDVGVLEEEKASRRKKIILLFVILLLFLFIIIDVVAVSKFDKGPYFAIPLKTYKDGGTKEYYGLGYKVIKYHQIQGRRDKQIGLWNIKYNTDALNVKENEIATLYGNNPVEAYQQYHKKFVRIKSTLIETNPSKSMITMNYIDSTDEKYNLTIICDVAKDQINLSEFEINKKITFIGTIKDFKTSNKNHYLYVENCFAEQ